MFANKYPFVCLSTTIKLLDQDVKQWFKIVNSHAPDGTVGSIQVEISKNGLKSIQLIYKKKISDNSELHTYKIPLTRNLLSSEVQSIVEAWNSFYDKDFTIETSGTGEYNQAPHQLLTGVNEITQSDYAVLCDTLAQYQHNRWYDEHVAKGWKYGLSVDYVNKTHPMLKPWTDLSQQQKSIDPKLPMRMFEILNQLGYLVVHEKLIERTYSQEILDGANEVWEEN